MILCHARAMAHEAIYQTSNPSVTYPKSAADVPNAAAEDWEPVPKVQEEEAKDLANGYDCGCDTVLIPQSGDTQQTDGQEDATNTAEE